MKTRNTPEGLKVVTAIGGEQEMKPWDKVYTRLGVSLIHGVGVYAEMDIPKGTDIFNEADQGDDDFVEVPEAEVMAMPEGPMKRMVMDFCPCQDHIFYCPRSFNDLTPSYYLNNSDHPNCVENNDGIYFVAARDIKAGEELTVSYATYDDNDAAKAKEKA